MFKKVILFLVSMRCLAVEDTKPELTTTEKVVLCSSLGIGAVGLTVIAAPYVLSSGAVAAIKAGVAAITTKTAAAGTAMKAAAIALPVVTKVSLAITVIHKTAQKARPYISPTQQEKLAAIKQQEANDKQVAKNNFVGCINRHKFDVDNDISACQQATRMFIMMASTKELKRV